MRTACAHVPSCAQLCPAHTCFCTFVKQGKGAELSRPFWSLTDIIGYNGKELILLNKAWTCSIKCSLGLTSVVVWLASKTCSGADIIISPYMSQPIVGLKCGHQLMEKQFVAPSPCITICTRVLSGLTGSQDTKENPKPLNYGGYL